MASDKEPGVMLDVCLVTMPLASVQRPSIGLGLLKALLRRDGLDARVCYANLWFLDYVGMELQQQFDLVRTEDVLVDWLFAAAAFPDHVTDDARYLERLFARNQKLAEHDPAVVGPKLLELRRQTPDFVDFAAREVLRQKPRIVGCTSTFQQHVASLALLRRIKALDPTVITMMGGANCETVMGRTTHQTFPFVDFVASGEADGYIARLCRLALEHGREVPAALLPEGVFGPAHRTMGYPAVSYGDGLPRGTFEAMDELPVPDYDDFFEELAVSLYRRNIMPGLPIETSRGCWWGQKHHCTFCGLNGGGMRYRSKSPDRALAEIETLVDRYGIDRVEAVDNILDMSYLGTVLPALAGATRRLNVFFETKANLKRHQVVLLRDAGVRWIQPGIESLSTEVLRLVDKGASAWNNVALLKWCRQHAVRVGWNLIVGFPGEDDAWYAAMARWLPLITHLQPGSGALLRYDRYSPYFIRAVEFGLKLEPSELYRYAYPLPPEKLADQVYFFEDANSVEQGRGIGAISFAGRPGLMQVRAALRAWRDAWDETPPTLTMREVGGALVVRDTRACAVATEHHIAGAARAVLRLCDAAPPLAQVAAAIKTEHGEAAVAAALADLVARKLVLELDGRAISLVLEDPVPPLPAMHEFPGGHVSDRPLPPAWQWRPPATQAAE